MNASGTPPFLRGLLLLVVLALPAGCGGGSEEDAAATSTATATATSRSDSPSASFGETDVAETADGGSTGAATTTSSSRTSATGAPTTGGSPGGATTGAGGGLGPQVCGPVSTVSGQEVTVEIVVGDVDCAAAEARFDSYYNDPPEPPSGSGGYVFFPDGWECNSSSSQDPGRVSTCRGPNGEETITQA